MNRIASLAILPLMTLAIVVFARFADGGDSKAAPPDSGTIVVANLRTETLSFIDLRNGEIRELVLPGPPHEMVEAGGRLYVTLGRGDALVEIEPRAGAILRVLPLKGEPHGLAVWGENLVVTLDAEHALVVLDRATLTEIRRYQTGDTPHVVAISSDAILVTDSRDDVLRQVVPRERTVSTGTQPEGIAIAGGLVTTADAGSGTLTVAKAADLSDAATINVGPGPVRVANVSDTRVVVSLQGEDRVAVVDLAKRTVERRIATGERPDGLCVSQAGDYFGSAANGDGTLSIYSTEDWKSVLRLNLNVGLGSCLWMDFR